MGTRNIGQLAKRFGQSDIKDFLPQVNTFAKKLESQGRLSTAVVTDQGNDLPRIDTQVHAREHVTLAERLRHAGEPGGRRARRHLRVRGDLVSR